MPKTTSSIYIITDITYRKIFQFSFNSLCNSYLILYLMAITIETAGSRDLCPSSRTPHSSSRSARTHASPLAIPPHTFLVSTKKSIPKSRVLHRYYIGICILIFYCEQVF